MQRFTPELIDAARPSRHVGGDRWFVDETYLKIAGRWVYLYRAIDQHGQVIDVLASQRRDLAAERVLALTGMSSLVDVHDNLKTLIITLHPAAAEPLAPVIAFSWVAGHRAWLRSGSPCRVR